MRDPLNWSLPLGHAFGISIRVHILFPFVALGFILRAAYAEKAIAGTWIDVAMETALLFVIVLLHEFGHCFGARRADGDASEILMWPLGGLAYTEIPHTPRAHFITVACGPAVNLVICFVAVLAFFWATGFDYRPTWNPLWNSWRVNSEGAIRLLTWSGEPALVSNLGVIVLARLFWLSWVLFLLNVCLPAFPLDGGRLFQCALWPRLGYAQATLVSVYAGFITAIVIGIISIMTNEVMVFGLALFIYVTCSQQMYLLHAGEEGVLGYDFSQGYTSLEQSDPQPRPKKPNLIQRWLARRAARKQQREQVEREAEERRMDELLQKVQDQGLQALTDEERRFLTRVSARYRNRQ